MYALPLSPRVWRSRREFERSLKAEGTALIPAFLCHVFEYLYREGSSRTEDWVDLEAVDKDSVERTASRIRNGEVIYWGQEEGKDVRLGLAVVMNFLRSLPDGLVPWELLRDHWEDCKKFAKGEGEECIRSLIESLSGQNQAILEGLVSLAAFFCSKKDGGCEVEKLSEVLRNSCVIGGGPSKDFLNGEKEEAEQICRKVFERMVKKSGLIFHSKYGLCLRRAIRMKGPVEPRGVNLLCLDGGGMRGLIEIEILAHIAEKWFGNSDADGTRKLMSLFDLVAGTSIGGILAIVLQKLSLKEAREFHLNLGRSIFGHSFLGWWRYFRTGGYYSSKVLQDFISNELGVDPPLKTSCQKFFVVSCDATNDQLYPYLFRSYVNPSSSLNGTCDVKTSLAMCATSAAPMYFPPIAINEHSFIDGGLIANNPTEFAIFEAHQLWPARKIDSILSLGTGVHTMAAGSTNLLQFINEVVDLCACSYLTHSRVLSWMAMLDHPPLYLRLTPPPPAGDFKLDTSDPKSLSQLAKMTEDYIRLPAQSQAIERLKEMLLSARCS